MISSSNVSPQFYFSFYGGRVNRDCPSQVTFRYCSTRYVLCRCTFLLKVKVKVAQSCPTLCDLMDYTVHGILQARILEWVAFPSPGNLPKPGIEPRSPTLRVNSYQSSYQAPVLKLSVQKYFVSSHSVNFTSILLCLPIYFAHIQSSL